MLTEEELIQNLPFYEKANKKTREILIKNAEKLYFSKGETLPYESKIGYFSVKKGNVYVYSEGENGGEYFLYRVSKDEGCVVLDMLKYVFGAQTELFALNEEGYRQAAAGPGGAYFLEISERQTKNAIAQFNFIMFLSVEKRIAALLLSVSARTRNNVVNYTHEQIAKLIGSGREVVTRKIAALCEENVIESSRGRIIIKNRDALKKKK